MDFTIVLAIDERHGVGKNGKIPWEVPLCMKFFEELTLGKVSDFKMFINGIAIASPGYNAIIMGRKTADGFKSTLPERLNVVITSIPDYRKNEGFESFSDLNKALTELSNRGDISKVYVIGGAKFCTDAMESRWCSGVFLTHMKGAYDCDTKISLDFILKLSKFRVLNVYKVEDGSIHEFEEYLKEKKLDAKL